MMVGSCSTSAAASMLYPSMFALHRLPGSPHGLVSQDGEVVMPPMVRLSSESLEAEGVYLLETGYMMLLWIGKNAHPQVCDIEIDFLPSKSSLLSLSPLSISKSLHPSLRASLSSALSLSLSLFYPHPPFSPSYTSYCSTSRHEPRPPQQNNALTPPPYPLSPPRSSSSISST